MVNIVRQNYQNNKKIYRNIYKILRYQLNNNIFIDHVGSTAIPNMYGKNIIDILIGVNNQQEFQDAKNILVKNNFIGSKPHNDGIYQFFASSSLETTSGDIHVHLVMKNTTRYTNFLLLKEYLLNHPDIAKEYSDYKRNLIKEGITNREEYKKVKSIYVSKLLDRAKL